jgi:hypothetical protein
MQVIAAVSAGYSGTAFVANLFDRYVEGAVGLHEPQPTYGAPGEFGPEIRAGRLDPLAPKVSRAVRERPWWREFPRFRGFTTSHVYENPTGREADGKRPETRDLDLRECRLLVESSIFLSPFVPAIRAERPDVRFVALFREPIAWARASWRKDAEAGNLPDFDPPYPTAASFRRRLNDCRVWNDRLLKDLEGADALWMENTDLFTPAGVRRLLAWALRDKPSSAASAISALNLEDLCSRKINPALAEMPEGPDPDLEYVRESVECGAAETYYACLARNLAAA